MLSILRQRAQLKAVLYTVQWVTSSARGLSAKQLRLSRGVRAGQKSKETLKERLEKLYDQLSTYPSKDRSIIVVSV